MAILPHSTAPAHFPAIQALRTRDSPEAEAPTRRRPEESKGVGQGSKDSKIWSRVSGTTKLETSACTKSKEPSVAAGEEARAEPVGGAEVVDKIRRRSVA